MPVAAFTVSVGNYGNVEFANSSTEASSFSWNFGDGSSSTAEEPRHMFEAGGTYAVTLTAIGISDSASTTKMVTIANSIVGAHIQKYWTVYGCTDNSLNNGPNLCTPSICPTFAFLSETLIIQNTGSIDTREYYISGDTLILNPPFTETFLLSNFSPADLTITAITTTGASAGCHNAMTFKRQ